MDKFRMWESWLDAVYKDVLSLLIHRHLFLELRKIVLGNPNIQEPPDFHNWMIRNYSVYTMVGIRRIADSTKSTHSLHQLLKDLAKHWELLTRERFVGMYEERIKHAGHRWFDREFGKNLEVVSKASILADAEKLKNASMTVKHIVDKSIAHLSKEALQITPPPFDEMHETIDLIETLFVKYKQLITGSSPQPLLSYWPDDWLTVFEKPWIVGE